MKRTMLCGAAAALIALPGISRAEFNYTLVDVSYANVQIDVGPFNVDGDGLTVGGSYTVSDSFFVGGSYENYDLDLNVDADVMEIGGGYFYTFNEDLDFVATFSYVDTEVSSGGLSANDDGLAIGGGVRARLSDRIDVDAMAKITDFDKGDSDSGVELRGRYFFNDDFAVTAQIDLGKDIETMRIGIRKQF